MNREIDSRTLRAICANSIVLFCLPLAILPNLLVSVLEKNSERLLLSEVTEVEIWRLIKRRLSLAALDIVFV